MLKLIPFKLDPMFRANQNAQVPCSDCRKVIEVRQARFVMVDISEKKKGQAAKEITLDELPRNTIWMLLCQECNLYRYRYPLAFAE
jgi:hypothetical protein